ncbi:hypothetical protein IGI04_000010 [Brassica rapa subsp. trilocularis]|uniref:Uncharacterized protein n=1 Tax=Brassica rapa subsp. trilocularis TaxID=1813537 RepID=A0ABQ7NNJ9_BRACM|nr:hypothetical protein IGI04_000010 [Brassica rapa subsp. trilocularis]
MRILPEPRGSVPCLILLVSSVLFSATLSLARVVEVVGYAESKIKNPRAFSGLRVTIECKGEKGHFVTKGSGNIDEEGKFGLKVLPHDIISDDGALKEECYAQLHSAEGAPCPAHDGLESNKIVFLYTSGDKHILGLKQNLRFTPELCVSKFFWPMPKFPPFKGFEHHFPLPPLFPKFKKPCPPPLEEVPPPPTVEIPPPVPVHDPSPKVELPPPAPKKSCPPKSPKIEHPPPVPVYKPPPKIEHSPPKKPCPPPVHVYKPPPKKVDPPPVPVHKIPPKKACPPKIELPRPHPPIYVPPVVIPKKPCPPLSKFPPLPPKYIHHPKFGKWPPLPTHP